MRQLPVFLNIQNKLCVVIGGGAVAARKTGLLLKAGASVLIVAPELGGVLKEWYAEGKINYRAGEFEAGDVVDAALVIAATDDIGTNKKVSDTAQAQSIPVNVVDTPELCTFTFGSIIERDPVTIAISSAGQSPVLARALKARLESVIPAVTAGR